MQIPVNQVFPNPEQPRTVFNHDELDALAQSIKSVGLIQPITVEDTGAGGYLLVDGERRWRAHRTLGLDMIEAHVRPATNHNGRERLTHALVANIQRANMGPIDEANAYNKLIREMGSIDAVGEHIGIATSAINVRIKMLEFDADIQRLFNLGKLPIDNVAVYALSRLPRDMQVRVAMTAATRGASGRLVVKLCKEAEKRSGKPSKVSEPRVRETHTGHFNALAFLVDENKIEVTIREKVKDTCVDCALYSDAGPRTCRECPMVTFLRKMAS